MVLLHRIHFRPGNRCIIEHNPPEHVGLYRSTFPANLPSIGVANRTRSGILFILPVPESRKSKNNAMAYTPQILAFAGSTRAGSLNKHLVHHALQGAKGAGAEATFFDLAAYPMPLYDADLEEREGIPETAKRVRALMKDHDGFLLASPEYNMSITGVLKNTIDWVSRPDGDDGTCIAFHNKAVTLMSASPSGFGGSRSLQHIREILSGMGCIVLPNQLSLPSAHKAFDSEGNLLDERKQQQVSALGADLAGFLTRLYG